MGKKMDKSKEQIQLEKKLNGSVRMLSKSTLESLGLAGIQEDDNVFFLGNNLYLKLYSLKKPALGDIRTQFVQKLMDATENRVRISTFHRNKDNKQSVYSFLSVYIEAVCYVDAKVQYEHMDDLLIRQQGCGLGIGIKSCSIDDVLMFIHMNGAGDMIRFEHNSMMGRRDNWKTILLPEIEDMEEGTFKCGERYGFCLSGKIIPFVKNDINAILYQREGIVQTAIDLQRVQPEEEKLFRFELGKRYNTILEESKFALINMSYMVSFLSDSKTARDQQRAYIEMEYDKRNFLMMPGARKENDIFCSICSLGIFNYHVMQNTYPSIAASLLL